MARIRKINVSQVEGNTNGVLPAGTIVAYDNGGDGYILRVHDGVTAGGVSLNAGQTPVIFNGNTGIVVDNLNEGIAALFNNGDVYITGGESLRFTGLDNIEGGSSAVLRFWNGEGRHSLDNDTTELVTLNVGNDADLGDPTLGFFKIITETQVGGEKEWKFDAAGNLTLPTGGDILDSNGDSILGSSTTGSNVWVQTFETVDGYPTDVVAVAISVEYDSAGNVIVLFTHYNNLTNSSYYSVGKYTTTGAKIWTARFGDDFNTDGWGLAVDNNTNTIYVAGDTNPETGGYSVSTLTKLDATDGSVLWSKTYDFGYESVSAVVDVASDGSPVMVGYAYNVTDRYVTTTKVSATDGSITWTRSLDGQNDEEANGMAVGPDGEIVVVGYMSQLGFGVNNAAATLTASPTSNANWVTPTTAISGVSFAVSLNAGVATLTVTGDSTGGWTVGDTVTTILGSVLGGTDGVDDMIVTVDSVTAVGSQDDHMLVVKYDSTGSIQWQKAILFDEGFNCEGADADIDSAGNIYVTGSYQYSFDQATTSALSILKLDSTGAKQWSRRVEGNCDTFGISVVVGADDKLYLSGMTGVNATDEFIWVAAKYGVDGTVEWQRLIDNTTGWSFTGGIFFSNGGGSNIAVKQDFVVLGGGFGDLINSGVPQATVVQVAAAGDVFSVGDWDFKAASFSGVLNGTASDITVINAGKTDLDNSSNVTTGTATLETEVSNFLLGTLYSEAVGNDRLVKSGNELVLSSTGTVTLPAGGTISEGIVTSNPTIQLTPASPSVASQKLVIKGGGNYINTENGIEVSAYNNTWAVNDSVTFYVSSADFANQTLYWWIVPKEGGISSTPSGTVALDSGGGGSFNFTLDSDDYEFTVRVSPTEDQYDPVTVGVQSVLMNPDAPTFGDYHLHLTTGDLTETSIFLGTDDHNVRTTTDGKIQITTPNTSNRVWEFDTNGRLTLPLGGQIKTAPGSSFNLQTVGELSVTVTNEAGTPMGPGSQTLTAALGDNPGVDTIQAGWIVTGTNLTETTTVVSVVDLGAGLYEITTDTTEIDPFLYGSVYTFSTLSPKDWEFGTDGSVIFPDSTIQTTAYVPGNTTVSKTSSGIPGGFSISPLNPTNLTPDIYTNLLVGFSGRNVTIDLYINESYNISIGNIRNASPATFVVGDSAVLAGNAFGGATPADDVTITVSSIEPTAIDVTKTINKLSEGVYTLADGVEGQIMYLVPTENGIDIGQSANVVINIPGKSRVSGRYTGQQYTSIGGNFNIFYPFKTIATPDVTGAADVYVDTNLCTLIFTDDAWQAQGGSWAA